MCFLEKINTVVHHYSSLQGPKKIFGGPQFDHACYILSTCYPNKKIVQSIH